MNLGEKAFVVAVVFAALVGLSRACTQQAKADEGCYTDDECIQQCLKTLPVNRPESECEDMFGDSEEAEAPANAHFAVYLRVRQ